LDTTDSDIWWGLKSARSAFDRDRDKRMKVSLVVDGVEIPLNDFTQQIIGNVSAGMASSLRGVNKDWKTLKITVERD